MNTYKRHRFPPDIISYAVWLYYRFNLIHRDIEDLLAERGITVSRETIRLWCIKFGAKYAWRLKRNHRGYGDTFFIDEVFVKINGASITKILNQTNTFGECMVFMDKTIADAGLDCPSKWVALSCDGTFNNRDVAARMHDAAMMAMAMEKKVNVLIDNTKKQNGYCVAKRIDLLK